MKFRVRSVATKETLRIEAPDPCSLHHLKTLVARALSAVSSASIPPDSIRLSLNRKDDLLPSSAHDSLDSLGLASGDLIYFSLAPDSQTLAPPAPEASNLASVPRPEVPGPTDDTPVSLDAQTLTLSSSSVPGSNEIASVPPLDNPSAMDSELNPPERSHGFAQDDQMEMDVEHMLVGKSLSVPCFLERVMEAEKGEDEGILGRLVITIQAVFLESGFMVSDGAGGNESRLPEGWASKASNLSVQYTLPELVGARDANVATLRISVMGNYVTVYGFLSGDHPDVYRVCFDLAKMAPLLSSSMDGLGEREEKEVFGLWKIVKDRLSLPLLIDICQKNGLPSPTCFMLLPTDIKMRVLEFLSVNDVAKIGCTCSELRYLSSNDDLWKKKFLDEFGLVDQKLLVGRSWKDKYVNSLVRRPERAIMFRMPDVIMARFNPVGFPMVGGDFDRFPAIGGGFAPASRRRLQGLLPRRHFSPDCNLGGNDSFFGIDGEDRKPCRFLLDKIYTAMDEDMIERASDAAAGSPEEELEQFYGCT